MAANDTISTGTDRTLAVEDDDIKVSVLMFVYNQAPYLAHAIDSVLAQKTNFRYEIIIHDDASTDGSAEIIRSYADRFPGMIVPILQSENQMSWGVSFVDEFIMPKVRGTYIAHCEGDDFWTSANKLAYQAAFLDAHPEYAGISHNCVVVDANGKPGRYVNKFHPYRRPYRYTLNDLILEDRMPGQTAAVMYRRACQTDMNSEAKQAYRNIRYAVGDRRRTLLILLNGPIYCVPRAMSAYRYVPHGGGNWNARIRGKNLAGRYYVQERDFRAFALKHFHTKLRNDYVLFGTGIMAHLRCLLDPNEENREQLALVSSVHRNAAERTGALLSYMPYAVFTAIRRPIQKIRWS